MPNPPSHRDPVSARFLLWDLPTRLFHWLLVVAVVGALISVELGMMVWHGRFGLAVVSLLAFRLAWGFIGPTPARFASFVTGPSRIRAYLQGRHHPIGHNPLGALAIVLMLLVLGFQATAGLFATDDIAYSGPLAPAVASATSAWLTRWHARMEWPIYGLVALHLLAITYYSLIRKESLIRPMITGHKRVIGQKVPHIQGGRPLALLVSLAVSAAVLWLAMGGLLAPPAAPPPDLGW